MKSVLSSNRKLLQILGVFAGIAVVFLYYYRVYIPKNESFYQNQKFRILRHTGSVLIEKVNAFNLLSDNYAKSDATLDILQKQLVTKNSDIFQSYDVAKTIPANWESKNHLHLSDNEALNFYGQGIGGILVGQLSKEKFLKPILSNRSFTGFFLAAENKIIYDGTDLGLDASRFLPETGLDSAMYRSFESKIEINGTLYRVFGLPLDLYSGENGKSQVVLCGFVPDKMIVSEIQEVQPYVYIPLLFILVFSMLLLPFFKIWVLGKKDRLNISDVAAVYVTAFLLVAVLSLWFLRSGSSLFSGFDRENKSGHALLDQMDASLNAELKDARANPHKS